MQRHNRQKQQQQRMETPTPAGAAAATESAASLGSDRDVTFCTVERVAGQIFVCIATTALHGWSIYRVNKFGAAPVQVAVDRAKDSGAITNVRFFRLFELTPSTAAAKAKTARSTRTTTSSSNNNNSNSNTNNNSHHSNSNSTPRIGALFVSERCHQRSSSCASATSIDNGVEAQRHVEDDDDAAMLDFMDDNNGNGTAQEDLTVFSLTDERIIKRLAPTQSLVLDIQFNRTTAAVLCEHHTIVLYDLATFEQLRCVATASPAMALGARWLAFAGVAAADRLSIGTSSLESDADDAVTDALVGATQFASTTKTEAPAITAIDVAQNVASGLYYLSEMGRATLAPYLSSSPSATSSTASTSATPVGSFGYASAASPYGSASDTHLKRQQQLTTPTATSASSGHATVVDLVTDRVVASFQCHATSLVVLAFDFSGQLLATCSTKGQNLHVYRLMPPLHVTHGKTRDAHQLLYKLQRGITHASIQDIAFSQDAKWLNVTTAHGTSHLFAIHPEGARIHAETHNNNSSAAVQRTSASSLDAALTRDVDDFYADFRTVETKTLTQVLKIRHAIAAPAVATASSTLVQPTQSPPLARSGAFLVESALDASQALWSHLASSTNLSIDFAYSPHAARIVNGTDDSDVEGRRRQQRRRISCLFAHDDGKMLIVCDRTLKLLELNVQSTVDANSYELMAHVPATSGAVARSSPTSPLFAAVESAKTKTSQSSAAAFGFDASVTELRSWELHPTTRLRTSSTYASDDGQSSSKADAAATGVWLSMQRTICSKPNHKSELRTFAPRSLPLWAHPKVTFRAIDAESPAGRVLEVKRKGPYETTGSGSGSGSDDQMFVLEMDSYFGIGGSPVFNGQQSTSRAMPPPDVPPLDLRESINLAMTTTLPPARLSPARLSPPPIRSATPVDGPDACDDNSDFVAVSSSKKAKKSKKSGRTTMAMSATVTSLDADASIARTSTALQFTLQLQDEYFASPNEPQG